MNPIMLEKEETIVNVICMYKLTDIINFKFFWSFNDYSALWPYYYKPKRLYDKGDSRLNLHHAGLSLPMLVQLLA